MIKTLCIIFLFPLIGFTKTKTKPLYEIGIAGGTGFVSDYPASNQGRYRSIFVPNFVYRGKVIKANDGGTKARFIKTGKLIFDISLGASLPSNSKDNEARDGMDDLDWLAEIGPRIIYRFIENPEHILQLEFPYRFVYSTDFSHTEYKGYRFATELDYTNKSFSEDIKTFMSIGIQFGSEKLHDNFYEVAPSDVTSNRERFNAKGGYIGSYVSTGFLIPFESAKYFIGLYYSNYSGNANQDGPLFKSSENYSFFVGLSYFFYKSDELSIYD